ncbi:MAG: hypothetical protein LBS68_00270 [Puniceicoccales bacterium]|jgi:DNA polymerase III epsilon subunit-like protein|nr:hypothetical protein [Puniceicoccales bacterium]
MKRAAPGKIFAIDFEGNSREGILEFGVIALEGDKLVDPVESFCRCERLEGLFLSRKKINPLHTASAPAIGAFFPLFQSMRRSAVLAAHGAATEDFLLRQTWPSPGFVPNWGDPGRPVITWGPWLDSLQLARRFWPHLPAHGLRDVLRALGLGGEWRELTNRHCSSGRQRPHGALCDAIGCALLTRECLRFADGELLQLIRGCGDTQLQLPMP